MTAYPTEIDSLPNPTAETLMDAAGFEHDVQHAKLNDAVVALQTKVGIDESPDSDSIDYKLRALQNSFATLTTTAIAEGTNLYYTAARFNAAFAGKTTGDLAEGANLYYTLDRFNAALATKTTNELAEGENLYFTEERADARINFFRGQANGIAALDNTGKLPMEQVPAALLGGANYRGTWDASVNDPELETGIGNKGDYYVVSAAGATSLDGITDWQLGDWAIFNGTGWEKVDNTDAVISVNGMIGAVALTTADLPESGNLYFTPGRVLATLLTGFSATTGAITSSDSVLSAFNKTQGRLAALESGTLPLTGGTLTGNLLFSTDNTRDIGAAGATRPRTGYFGTSIVTPLVTIAAGANANAFAVTGYSLTSANAQSLLDLAGTWNTTGTPTAIKLNITNTASNSNSLLMDLQTGGTTQFKVGRTGIITVAAESTTVPIISCGNGAHGIGGSGAAGYLYAGGGQVALFRQGTQFCLEQNTGYAIGSSGTGSADVIMLRDAAGVFGMRNGASSVSLRLYNTYTSAGANYERLAVQWASNVAQLWTEKAGTGTARDLVLGANATEYFRISALGNVSIGNAALATNATDGFLHIPSCAGTPTGTPSAVTGRVPLVYDSSNNKLYAYVGGWKSITLA